MSQNKPTMKSRQQQPQQKQRRTPKIIKPCARLLLLLSSSWRVSLYYYLILFFFWSREQCFLYGRPYFLVKLLRFNYCPIPQAGVRTEFILLKKFNWWMQAAMWLEWRVVRRARKNSRSWDWILNIIIWWWFDHSGWRRMHSIWKLDILYFNGEYF